MKEEAHVDVARKEGPGLRSACRGKLSSSGGHSEPAPPSALKVSADGHVYLLSAPLGGVASLGHPVGVCGPRHGSFQTRIGEQPVTR